MRASLLMAALVMVLAVTCRAGDAAAPEVEEAPVEPVKVLHELTAKEWFNVGRVGGGFVYGESYLANACFVKTLTLEPTHGAAWYSLGLGGGGTVSDVFYNKKDCFGKALAIDGSQQQWWHQLAAEWGGKVDGKHFTRADCNKQKKVAREGATKEWQHAVKTRTQNPGKTSNDWFALAEKNGGTVDGQTYGQKECYEKAITANAPEETLAFSYSRAWARFGGMGGGTVNGEAYSSVECILKALRISPSSPVAWLELGRVGGGALSGAQYTERDCYVEVASVTMGHNRDRAMAWLKLGELGGAGVRGVWYGQVASLAESVGIDKAIFLLLAKALESPDASNLSMLSAKQSTMVKENAVWLLPSLRALAAAGGGTVRDISVEPQQLTWLAQLIATS
jgi:hypothetical protein